MTKAIGNALIWGVIYFFVGCFLHNFVFSSTHTFFGQADQVLETCIILALGYFFGYWQGQNNPTCNAVLQALIWGVIYSFVGCFLHNFVFSSTHTFFVQADQVLETCIVSALGYFFGCGSGKRS